jgi:hypothetical protein
MGLGLLFFYRYLDKEEFAMQRVGDAVWPFWQRACCL